MATSNKPLQEAFGDVLREARVDKGLSQQDLSQEADLDRTYVSMLERGLRQPTLTTIVALAAALELQAETLVSRTIARFAAH